MQVSWREPKEWESKRGEARAGGREDTVASTAGTAGAEVVVAAAAAASVARAESSAVARAVNSAAQGAVKTAGRTATRVVTADGPMRRETQSWTKRDPRIRKLLMAASQRGSRRARLAARRAAGE